VPPPVVVPPVASTADADFAARCAGALKCEGFDAPFALASGTDAGLHATSGGLLRGFQDATIKTSGASSLRFDILTNTPADAAGGFIAAMGQSFGPGSTFYVQFRQRMDDTMANFNWGSTGSSTAPKSAIFYGFAGGTCQSVELTTVSYAYAQPGNRPTMYTDCGGYGMDTNIAGTSWVCPTCTPKLIQQGDFSCAYGSYGPSCFVMPANKWVTFYYKVQVGAWGSSTSSVEAWVAMDGLPYKQFIKVPNIALNNDSPASDNNYSRVMLTPYMTGKNSGVAHPTARVWYDELIVSTKPIAAPNN
jgi:hypothetical protein